MPAGSEILNRKESIIIGRAEFCLHPKHLQLQEVGDDKQRGQGTKHPEVSLAPPSSVSICSVTSVVAEETAVKKQKPPKKPQKRKTAPRPSCLLSLHFTFAAAAFRSTVSETSVAAKL